MSESPKIFMDFINGKFCICFTAIQAIIISKE